MLIYVHGFRSSPQSFKAQMLAQHMAEIGRREEFSCPALPVSPREAIELIRDLYRLSPQDTLVGSSLGGYYATWLAEKTGCSAVLLNPAIRPERDLAPYVGELRTYHDDQPMHFWPEYLDQLAALETPVVTSSSRYYLIAAKGDELLDWREMVGKYPDVKTNLLEGGDHGLSDFDEHLQSVLDFAGYRKRQTVQNARRGPS